MASVLPLKTVVLRGGCLGCPPRPLPGPLPAPLPRPPALPDRPPPNGLAGSLGALAWLDLGYVLWDAVCELSVVSAYADPFLCYSSNGTKTV